ncbi:Trk family potassium uptake protein [Paenibacillus sp. S3N08]|uniref:Trk family potassium uptake protein n=1 Tax=Paenibacillus agricola TaxID=2716264 RepID=A0ABX0J814_9BACL|nr:TrkH family potassium uptake protein [Paenibacillus agricola]NHN31309.1 Trk family potassium uptake protein [Paenibacillus agricola]
MNFPWKPIRLNPQQTLALGFAVIIFLGSFLLWLPISSVEGRTLSYIDALFTATSATCVTGLIVVDTGTHFTYFGQIVLLFMMQLGGLGFMTMTTWFAIVVRKRISLREKLVLKESLNQTNIEGIVRLIKNVIIYSLIVESIAAVCFTIRWSFEMPFGKAVYFGVFHAVSLFNNAGFELFGGFRNMTLYVDDIFINVVSMVLVILGGLGFIVLSELIDYSKTRRLSLHSKIVLSLTAFLTVLGAVVIFIFEYTNMHTFGALSLPDKILAAFFQSVSLRSSGTNTVDIAGLRQATQFFMIVLMFIGAAPGSTGGGIKITTFAILIGAVLAMLRRKEDVVLFRFRLGQEYTHRAITVTLMSLLLIFIVTMLLLATQEHSFLMILFEAASAFGTVGLSMGLTLQLTITGKIVIILMMFIGRLGPVTMAYALQPKNKKELFHYPEGKMIIG